jgi:hypothetical protein
MTAGAQSDEVNNSSNLYKDVLVSGSFKVGTSPAAGTIISVWVVPCMDGGSTYPDVITGAGAAAKTITSFNVLMAMAKLLKTIAVDSTTGRVYAFSNESVADLFGYLPQKFVLYVTQATTVNLDSSAGGSVNMLGVNDQAI